MAKPTKPAVIPAPAAEQTTTVSGYAISILAFIPVSKKDLARQIEVPTLLRDISEGKKTIADLAGYLQGTEMKMNFINKRFPISEARAMMTPPPAPADRREEDEEDEADDEDKLEPTAEPNVDEPGLTSAE